MEVVESMRALQYGYKDETREINSLVPNELSSVRVHCDNKTREIGLSHDYNMTI